MSTRRPRALPRLAAATALAAGLGLALAVASPAATSASATEPAAVAAATTVEDAAAALLQGETVYVAPESAAVMTGAQADQVRAQVRDSGYSYFVAVLPKSAAVDGSSTTTLATLARDVGEHGTYVLWMGDSSSSAFRAADTDQAGVVAPVATLAYSQHKAEGAFATITAFIDRSAPLLTGSGTGTGDSGTVGDPGAGFPVDGGTGLPGELGGAPGGGAVLAVLGVGALAVGGLGVYAYRKNAAATAERTAAVRRTVDEDVTAYGEAVARLDVEDPHLDDAGRADAQRALDAYENAKAGAERMARPEDAQAVTSALEDGRFALACVQARLAGTPLPERRPPCFVDPRHGPSVKDVMWAPDGGAVRPVPVCQACAVTLESGALPRPREVEMAGQRMPYWAAGRQYAPYAGGYYASSGADLMTALFVGSMLGGAFSHPAYVDHGSQAGGIFGGGDFRGGGGDFGGGGFGGGDFGGGGGSFGGGGDF